MFYFQSNLISDPILNNLLAENFHLKLLYVHGGSGQTWDSLNKIYKVFRANRYHNKYHHLLLQLCHLGIVQEQVKVLRKNVYFQESILFQARF